MALDTLCGGRLPKGSGMATSTTLCREKTYYRSGPAQRNPTMS